MTNTINRLPYKDRWNLLPQENIGTSPFAFTLNCGYDELTHKLYERYLSVFLKLAQWCWIDLRPEFSKKMKLHYHGTLTMKNYKYIFPLFTFLNGIQKNYTYCLKPVYDWQWYIYCRKQRHLMKRYMISTRLRYHIRNDKIITPNITDILGFDLREDLINGLDYGTKQSGISVSLLQD